jgi:RimJ/RimL family protein N-acetyltransferase
MQECPVDHPALPGLFDLDVPNHPVLWAVLRGRNAGRALVDELENPSECLLRTDAALTFASPRISQDFLDRAIQNYRREGEVWLLWPESLSARLTPSEPAERVERIEFRDCDAHSEAQDELRRRLPSGYEMRPIDRPLLQRCVWRDDMAFYCGSLDNFLVNGVGLCMMRGDEIIVETYASSLGEGYAETGAITNAAYRGRGYAPIACAYLFEALERRGFRAYWSCDAGNPASIRVAQKLGFRSQRVYQILEYPALS